MQKQESFLLGVDDAGRGPVIGPMVLAGCLITEEVADELRKLGVKDSKQVTRENREKLAKVIRDKAINFHYVLIHPEEIDARQGAGTNLNKIEAIKSAEIINKLNHGKKIKVAVDCPSTNIQAWQAYLEKHLIDKENLILNIEHKADINHVACSAASIIAKTIRDAEIEKIKIQLGVNFGSGYPSDPVTQEFLKENFSKYKKEKIFRETWGTVLDFKAKKAQKKLLDF